MLLQICRQNGFQANPRKIFNMHECRLQMNGEPGKVFANKSSQDVHRIPSGEKGETVNPIACCNAEGISYRLTAFLKERGRMNSNIECHLVPE
jgi:hypothetical protein